MEQDLDLKRIPRSRRVLFLSIPYLFLALVVLGIEGGTRLLLPHVPPLDVFIEPAALRPDIAENKDSPIYMADPLLFWRVRPNLKEVPWDFTMLSTNDQGWRTDHHIGRKPRDGFRIVCVGDSVTFGFRVPMVFAERSHDYDHNLFPYPALCEKRLQGTNPSRRIEVIPLAVPGYTSYQGLNLLRRDIVSLKPDVVTVCFGWNDVCLRSLPDRILMPVDWPRVTARTLMCHSQALLHFARWQRRKQSKTNHPANAVPVARVSRDDYVANLLAISKLAREHGAQAVVIGQVYRDARANPPEAKMVGEYRDALREAAAANGVPYLQVDELIETNYPANDRLFGEAIHPNAAGHEIMATALLKFLADHKMLDSLQFPETLSNESPQ
jgi:lysophospholipase L1-like esterase